MKWARGYLLESYNGTEYTYDAYGNRVQVKSGEMTRDYLLDGDRILVEKISVVGSGTKFIQYQYNEAGVSGIYYSGYHLLEHDAQGNVIAIYNAQGCEARYTYDAWGNCKVTDGNGNAVTDPLHIGNVNPLRWKGHYYDASTGLYYINGNYYDPELGRYVASADVEDLLEKTGDRNLYSLGDNNPMMFMQNLMGIEATLEFYAAYQMYERPMDFWDRLFIGIGAIVAGIGAILLGVSSLGCTVPGGIALIALGGVTILGGGLALAFAVNDIVYYNTGYNAFRVKFGWDQTTYEKIEKGVMITAVVLTLICEIVTGAVRARQCFIAGTLVLCQDENGEEIQKPIEEVEVGDLVWAYDEETGESDWKPVVRLFRNTTKEWYHIKVNEEEIICTGEHPFYVEGRGFVFAKNLKINDKLLQNSGKYATIKEIKIQKLVKDEITYNFEVADFHTYYVSNLNILVHNTCKVDLVIKETLNGKGNITSKYSLTPDEALEAGQKFLGKHYTEIGKPGSGVFRSGNRIFRIDVNSLKGLHSPNVSHFHLEILDSTGLRIVNNHISII